MTEVYKVWCEWEIGVEDVVYSSYEVAKKNAVECLKCSDIEESFDDLEKQRCIGIELVQVITK